MNLSSASIPAVDSQVAILKDKLAMANAELKVKEQEISRLNRIIGKTSLKQESNILAKEKFHKCFKACLKQLERANLGASELLKPERIPDLKNLDYLCNWLSQLFSKAASSFDENAQLRRDKYGQKSNHASISNEATTTPPASKTKEEQLVALHDKLEKHAADLNRKADVIASTIDKIQKTENDLANPKEESSNPKKTSKPRHCKNTSGTLETSETLGTSGNSVTSGTSETSPSNTGSDNLELKNLRPQTKVCITGIVKPVLLADRCYCPECGRVTYVWLLSSKLRCRELIHIAFQKIPDIENAVVSVKCKNDHTFELNPSGMSDLEVSSDKTATASTNTTGTTAKKRHYKKGMKAIKQRTKAPYTQKKGFAVYPEVTANNSKEFKEQHNEYAYSGALLDYLIWYKGAMMFNPDVYEGERRAMYSMRGAYVGCKLSQGTLTNLLLQFSTGLQPKSRIYEQLVHNSGVEGISRGYIIDFINQGIRAFCYKVALYHRQIMLETNKVIHADETTYIVREHCKNSGRRKSYLWCLVSGEHEKYQGVYFNGATTRNTEDFYDTLGFTPDDIPKDIAIEYLCTDSYGGYFKGVNELNAHGLNIKQQLCWSHVRSKWCTALDSMGYLDFFKRIKSKTGQNITQFGKHLKDELQSLGEDAQPSDLVMSVICIIFLIDVIFHYEATLKNKEQDEVLAFRQKYLLEYVDDVFTQVKALAADSDNCVDYTINADGTYTCKSNNGIPFTKAIVYQLNSEHELRTAFSYGGCSIHNNISERMIRPTVQQRKLQLFLTSSAGFKSYACIKSLECTCRINGIPFVDYLEWLVQEMKHRLEEYRYTHHISTQICLEPGRQRRPAPTQLDPNHTEPIGLYDEDYFTQFDRISLEGLTVWDYRALRIRGIELRKLKNS